MTRSVEVLGAFEVATVAAVRAASTLAPAGLELVFELKSARLVEIARAGFVSNFFCSGFFDSLLLFTAAPTFDPAACAERKHRSRGLALVQWQGGGDDKFRFFPPHSLTSSVSPSSLCTTFPFFAFFFVFFPFLFFFVLIQLCALLSRSRQKQRQDRALLDDKVVTSPAVVRAMDRQSRFQRANNAFASECSLPLAAVVSSSLKVREVESGKLGVTSVRFKCEPSCQIGGWVCNC